MFDKIIGRFYIKKARKTQLNEFARILEGIPKVTTVKGCYEGYVEIAEFVKALKNDDPIKALCGKLIDYLMDTKEHINKGYHKSLQTEWKTKTTYPDVNEYFDIGVRVKNF